MKCLAIFALGISLSLSVKTVTLADDWPGPQVMTVFSSSGEYFVRVTPGESIGDTFGFEGGKKGHYAKAEFYSQQRDRSYKLAWESELLNPVAPVEVFLSNNGYLITLDNWHNIGYGKVIVFYTPQGATIRSYDLTNLFSESQVKGLRHSVSSRYWRDKPSHFVDPKTQDRLYVPDTLEGYFVFNVATGQYEYNQKTKSEK